MKNGRTIFCISLLLFSFPALALGAGLTMMEQLGKIMYQDKDFSRNATQSCQTCHHHISGFADPTNMRDPEYTVVSLGDDGVSLGGRNAPSSAYCGFSPPLKLKDDGTYVGGLFWDGRANGHNEELQDPLAEQAQGPPLNPVEMNMESVEAVVDVVRNARYRPLFLKVFGATALDDNQQAFDNIARAIAAYERSLEVQRFSSRFDSGQLSEQEMRGLGLVEKHCSSCHATTVDTSAGYSRIPPAPLFTNYSYANIGIPVNPLLEKDPSEPDLGLGGVLDDRKQDGKFKVPTLRNVAFTAPYGHNGYFPTLRDILDFKSYRDVYPDEWDSPEVDNNLSMEVGSFNFTEEQINDIVAFLQSLTDQ